MGGGGEGASEAFLVRVPAPLLPRYVGGGDRRRWLSGHRQDPGYDLPDMRTQVSFNQRPETACQH